MSPRLRNTAFNRFLRAMIEVAFIIFLFYANLLMGEFTQTNMQRGKTLTQAMGDVFTPYNFGIAVGAAVIGFIIFEFLRRKFR